MYYNYCQCCGRTWQGGYATKPAVIKPSWCYQCGVKNAGRMEWRMATHRRTATHCEHGQPIQPRLWH